MNTPELDKMIIVQPKSQAIGEFLVWLQENKGVSLGHYHDHTPDCYETAEDFEYDEAHDFKRGDKSNRICGFHENNLFTAWLYKMEDILAEYFGIDTKKAEEERRAIFAELQERAVKDSA